MTEFIESGLRAEVVKKRYPQSLKAADRCLEWMNLPNSSDGHWRCSRPTGHDGPHVAYALHDSAYNHTPILLQLKD